LFSIYQLIHRPCALSRTRAQCLAPGPRETSGRGEPVSRTARRAAPVAGAGKLPVAGNRFRAPRGVRRLSPGPGNFQPRETGFAHRAACGACRRGRETSGRGSLFREKLNTAVESGMFKTDGSGDSVAPDSGRR